MGGRSASRRLADGALGDQRPQARQGRAGPPVAKAVRSVPRAIAAPAVAAAPDEVGIEADHRVAAAHRAALDRFEQEGRARHAGRAASGRPRPASRGPPPGSGRRGPAARPRRPRRRPRKSGASAIGAQYSPPMRPAQGRLVDAARPRSSGPRRCTRPARRRRAPAWKRCSIAASLGLSATKAGIVAAVTLNTARRLARRRPSRPCRPGSRRCGSRRRR